MHISVSSSCIIAHICKKIGCKYDVVGFYVMVCHVLDLYR